MCLPTRAAAGTGSTMAGASETTGAGGRRGIRFSRVPVGLIETIIQSSRAIVLRAITIPSRTPTIASRSRCRVPLVLREERGREAAQGPGDRRAAHLLPLPLRLLLRVLPVLLPIGSRRGAVCLRHVPRGSCSTRIQTNVRGSFTCSQLRLPALRQLASGRGCRHGSGSCWGVLF